MTECAYKQDDKVRLKPEYCDAPGEENDVWIVVENRGERLLIEVDHWPHGPIKPQTVVGTDMVRPHVA